MSWSSRPRTRGVEPRTPRVWKPRSRPLEGFQTQRCGGPHGVLYRFCAISRRISFLLHGTIERSGSRSFLRDVAHDMTHPFVKRSQDRLAGCSIPICALWTSHPGLADEVGSDAIPDAAGGESGHGAAKSLAGHVHAPTKCTPILQQKSQILLLQQHQL
jgi:hypothetical protein